MSVYIWLFQLPAMVPGGALPVDLTAGLLSVERVTLLASVRDSHRPAWLSSVNAPPVSYRDLISRRLSSTVTSLGGVEIVFCPPCTWR